MPRERAPPPTPRAQIFAAATRSRGLTGGSRAGAGGAGVGGAGLVALLSELTGAYAVSSLLLIRRNVPLEHRAAIDEAVGGTLEFQFFHRCGGRWRMARCKSPGRQPLPAHPCPPRAPSPAVPCAPAPPPRWFNALFIASALLTAALYWARHRVSAGDGLGDGPVLPLHAKGAAARQ